MADSETMMWPEGANEYPHFRPITRLFREITITEKIDGTNGLISIEKFPFGTFAEPGLAYYAKRHGNLLLTSHELDESGMPISDIFVRVGSRNRWLTPDSDNFGFARWVWDNVHTLVEILGEGKHYGEWWGSGIQRNYGQRDKHFSLFNTKRWSDEIHVDGNVEFPNLRVVPILYAGEFKTAEVDYYLEYLKKFGSSAVPDWPTPEGVVIWHSAAQQYFKATIENDEKPKALVTRGQK